MLTHILEAFLNGDPKSLFPALGAVLGGGWDALKDKWNDLVDDATGRKEVEDYLKDLFEDMLPDPEMWNHTREKLDELYENAKSEGEEVIQAEVALEPLLEYRRRFPALNDMRAEYFL